MAKGFPLYKEQLEMILGVTQMLNENSEKIPVNEDFYFRVQLVEAHSGETVGEWSDEIGPDCWEFSFVTPDAPKIQLHGGVPGARGQ